MPGPPPPPRAGEGAGRQGRRRDRRRQPATSTPAPEVKGYGANPAEEAPALASRGLNPVQHSEAAPQPRADAGDRVKASPLARRLAEQRGIDLAGLTGSGPGGRIVKADVDGAAGKPAAAAAAPAQAPAQAAAAPAPSYGVPEIPHEVAKLSNMRKTIARRLTEAKQTSRTSISPSTSGSTPCSSFAASSTRRSSRAASSSPSTTC